MIEVVFLICTYTLLIISLFLQVVCFKRNIEFIETIAFTVSLLLLIIAISASTFFNLSSETESVNIFILISMVFVGLTTPLNIWQEREYNIPEIWKKYAVGISMFLFAITILSYFSSMLIHVQYVVTAFLGISVFLSMVFIRMTKPKKRFAHREKIERILSILFLVLVPLSLIVEFYLLPKYQQYDIGILLPVIFMILAGSKIWDDLERLSLFKTKSIAKEQQLKNYSLTEREQEIALFLTKGMTYKKISEELYIAMPTVKTHVSNIYKKCGVKNKFELISLLIN